MKVVVVFALNHFQQVFSPKQKRHFWSAEIWCDPGSVSVDRQDLQQPLLLNSRHLQGFCSS